MKTITLQLTFGILSLLVTINPLFGQYFGIGLDTPTELLHLKDGNLFLDTGDIFFQKTGVPAFDSKIYLSGNNLNFKGAENVNIISGQYNNVLISNFSTSYIEFNGLTESMGIGTSPSYELDVNGTTRTNGFIMPTGAANGYVLTSGNNGVATWQAAADSDWQIGSGIIYNLGDKVAVGATTSTAKMSITNPQTSSTLKSLSIKTTKNNTSNGTVTNLEIIGNQQNNGRMEGLNMILNRQASTSGDTQGMYVALNGNSTNDYMEGGRISVNRQAGNASSIHPVCGMHTVSTSKDGTGVTYGNRIVVCSEGSGDSYGVYSSYSNSCTLGGTYYSGYFVGEVYTTGCYLPSDLQLKKNVRPLTNSLDRLLSLSVNEYSYDNNRYPQMNLPQGQQTGFLAQNVEQFFPNLIKNTTQPGNQNQADADLYGLHPATQFKAVNYTGLIPHTVKAIQEQQATIAELEAKLAVQEKMITSLQEQIDGITAKLDAQ